MKRQNHFIDNLKIHNLRIYLQSYVQSLDTKGRFYFNLMSCCKFWIYRVTLRTKWCYFMSIVAFNFLSDICTYVPLNIKIDKNKEQCSVPSLVEVVLEKKSWILRLSQRPYTGWMHERAPYYGYIEIKLLLACLAGQLVSC